MKILLSGFILALLYFAFLDKGFLQGVEPEEQIRHVIIASGILTPVVAFGIWVVVEAGLPLLREFVEGNLRSKLLILSIVIISWKLKMG